MRDYPSALVLGYTYSVLLNNQIKGPFQSLQYPMYLLIFREKLSPPADSAGGFWPDYEPPLEVKL